ncbi:hypothetical protein [Solirhodobacter olei]|uniref:hypothetical protein n=1 Tax=Solirhodobacter olei TaxID=2493082 RepID=UPI003BAD9F39
MVERFIRTLKGHCVHRHRLERIQHATRVVGDSIIFDNNRRPLCRLIHRRRRIASPLDQVLSSCLDPSAERKAR